MRTLVELSGAPLICTPRAKGILPAEHPRFIGMTGLGCDELVESYFARNPVDHVLILGSRLGEASSYWVDSYIPKKEFIHVDLNTRAMSAAYPHVPTWGIQSEIRSFVSQLLLEWPRTRAPRDQETPSKHAALELTLQNGPARPSTLMRVVQREIVDKSDAPVLVDVGNAFSFSNRYLDFSTPNRCRVHFDFGAMGCASAGVLGTAIATKKKAVAIVGDGALLMHNEINTAARYSLPCVWIVLNDARYGMVAQGLDAMFGVDGHSEFPKCDFVQIAKAMGADGISVGCESDLPGALQKAMSATGPFVVDVSIDRSEAAPSGKRFVTLQRQGEAS